MDEAIDFGEFEAGFNGDDYQTDTESSEDTADIDLSGADTAEAVEESTAEENSDSENAQDNEEKGTEDAPEADKGNSEQMFTIKVNKEEKQLNLAQMTEMAQKGADYDRVKGQLAESRQKLQELQAEYDSKQDAIGVLEMIAQSAGKTLEQTVAQMQKNFLMNQGRTEKEAEAEIRAINAEKQLNAMKTNAEKPSAEDANRERADREIGEFKEQFPDVELTEELCNKLMADVQNGMSLTNAYLKMENARIAAEKAELQKQLDAEKKNKENRRSTPGSQKDSGGTRSTSNFDDFMSAFK